MCLHYLSDYLKQVIITRNKPRRLTIACQEKNAVISSIVVTPGSNTKPCCLGSTVFFLTDAYNCYWKSKCWVNVPVDDITTPKNCQRCTGSTPNYSARCFTKSKAHPFNALIFLILRGCVQSFVIFLSLNSIPS